MKVLVTGAKGMIGSQLVEGLNGAGYEVIGVDKVAGDGIVQVDLADKEKLAEVAKDADRFIHLAALAHTAGENDLSWERYKHVNIDCARNVFEVAGDRPVLFISTVDVYGFYDGKKLLDGTSPVQPVSKYGKSKVLAEEECKKLPHYTVFRFSPVYTSSITRDIQKRYYLKYPQIVYQIGKGTAFEILNITGAVAAMVEWCSEAPNNEVRIIKDEKMMWTPDYIKNERKKGNAKIKLWFPRWIVNTGYILLKNILGENEKTYLLNKAVYPLRTR